MNAVRPSVPEIVIHVGLHKTGSTLLQRALRDLRQELAKRGVLVRPRDEMYEDTDFRRLVRGLQAGRLLGRRQVAHVTERTRTLMQPGDFDRLVFSDETLLGTFPDFRRPCDAYSCGIPALRWMVDSVAAPTPVRVLLYVRRQDQFLESVYLQEIHQGSTETFGEWFSTIDVARFDWLSLSRRVEEVVGDGRLVVRPFETISDGAAKYFAAFLGLVDPGLVASLSREVLESIPHSANRSLSGKALDIALLVYPMLTQEERFKLRRFLQVNFSTGKYPRAELLTREQRTEILEIHRSANSELFERHIPDHDPVTLGYV
jgi:hypothetical protein